MFEKVLRDLVGTKVSITKNKVTIPYDSEPDLIRILEILNIKIDDWGFMNKEYKLNSVVIMKKQHPCGENKWEVVRTGVDIKIKCLHCNREILMERREFEKKLKKIKGETNEKI